MKKVLLTMMVCLAIAGISTSCSGRRTSSKADAELRSVVRDFNRKDGFNVIYVNGLLTSLAKSAAGVAVLSDDMDPDAMAAIRACRDIKGIIVVDYEDASREDALAFRRKLDNCLKPEQMLLECKDEEDNVRIWANSLNDDSIVDGLVIDVDGEALVYIKGKVNVNELYPLMAD